MSSKNKTFELEGQTLSYPTYFHDGSSSMGVFTVNADVADKLIAESGFKCARVTPRSAILSLVCVHYTDTECGRYEEIALAFFVQRHGRQARKQIPYLGTWIDILRGDVASYTWCLPVSSTLSRDCGISMWGFPKTLETIEYSLEAGRTTSTWLQNGELVMSYSVPARGDKDTPEIAPAVYSILDKTPCVSYLKQRYSRSGRHGRDGILTLGNHPAADTLRRLGLPKKPLFAGWNGHLEFEMSHPEPL